LSTLKEIRKELKDKRYKKEDINMAFAISRRLETLDRMVFPENPSPIGFSMRKNRFGFLAAHGPPEKDTGLRYFIHVEGINELVHEEKNKKWFFIPKNSNREAKLVRFTWEELLVSVAAHEVRHRVQHDCSIKKFSPRSACLIEDHILRSVIEFNKKEFEKREQIYIRDNEPKVYIKNRINRKEFDASTIEIFITNKIHGKDAYSLREEIARIIKLQAP
jgi:hypothetical protein